MVGAFSSSCSDDGRYLQPAVAGNCTLSFVCGDMLPQFIDPDDVVSRASDPKKLEEKEIRTLHLFFFAPDGTLANKAEYNNFLPYQKLVNTSVLKIPDDAVFYDSSGADVTGKVTVVAIANINAVDTDDGEGGDGSDTDPNRFLTACSPGGKIPSGTRGGMPYEINTLDDIRNWVYAPKLRSDEGTDIRYLPRAGMPMIKIEYGVNLKQTSGNRLIQMKALMARVDINIRLEPNQESRDGLLPQMRIRRYGIKNLPTSVPFTAPTGWDGAAGFEDAKNNITTAEMEEEVLVEPDGGPIFIDKNTGTVHLTYYTYENVQLPDYENAVHPDGMTPYYTKPYTEASKPGYSQGVDAGDMSVTQRWKPRLANPKASAMTIEADYRTHQNLNYQAKFTIYMGGNPADDFQVKRNCQYTSNITVCGLDYVRNSDDDTYSFDARVNVSSGNPFYLAIVNERKVDAHATALPMDVWLLLREVDNKGAMGDGAFGWHSEVKVSLRNPLTGEAPDWIAMDKVPRSMMEKDAFVAGTGARDYFGDKLVDELIGQGGSEVTIDSDVDKSRSRVYFYIDENVDVRNANYGDRYATVYITYTRVENGTVVETRSRTLEIEQRALVKVNKWKDQNWPYSEETIDSWMEHYEEYLEHHDPLDKHEMPGEYYSGLPWGMKGESVNRVGVANGGLIYRNTQAVPRMRAIIAKFTDYPIPDVVLFNTKVPASAFHYCYGKNKRDSNGNVVESKGCWYLPGIRELEAALVEHYTTFPNFRTEKYWSCANGVRSNVGLRELTDKARATGLDKNMKYIESLEGDEGCIDRDKPLRIRAFYAPK